MDTSSRHKQLKKDRVRQVFVETVCRLVSREGVGAVSVRRVADEAAYALATLYKYFRNLDELLWYARIEMINAVASHFQSRMPVKIDSWDELKTELAAFLAYFAERPTVFRFLYFHSLDPASRPAGASGNEAELAASMAPVVGFLAGKAAPDKAADIVVAGVSVVAHSLMGMLSLLIGGNDAMDKEALDDGLERLCVMLKVVFPGNDRPLAKEKK